MKEVYNLEYEVRDKIGRVKEVKHVGVYPLLRDVGLKKEELLRHNPELTFRVYIIEHIFS